MNPPGSETSCGLTDGSEESDDKGESPERQS